MDDKLSVLRAQEMLSQIDQALKAGMMSAERIVAAEKLKAELQIYLHSLTTKYLGAVRNITKSSKKLKSAKRKEKPRAKKMPSHASNYYITASTKPVEVNKRPSSQQIKNQRPTTQGSDDACADKHSNAKASTDTEKSKQATHKSSVAMSHKPTKRNKNKQSSLFKQIRSKILEQRKGAGSSLGPAVRITGPHRCDKCKTIHVESWRHPKQDGSYAILCRFCRQALLDQVSQKPQDALNYAVSGGSFASNRRKF